MSHPRAILKYMNESTDITSNCIQKVLGFKPYFENKTNDFYKMSEGSLIDPFIYSDKVEEFIRVLYVCNFVQGFDWTSWQDKAAEYVNDKHLLDEADIQTIIKLLTTHIRRDRFSSGHLASMIDNGHIAEILKRLDTINRFGDIK